MRQLSFNVSIVDDMISENDETFTARLTLAPADRARLGNRVTVNPDLATVTIEDDDGTIHCTCSYLDISLILGIKVLMLCAYC